MVVAVSRCSRCGSQTLDDDTYCQECGKFLGSETTDTHAPTAVPAVAEPHQDEFLTNLSPRSAKPVVSLPVVAGGIALLLLIPFGIYAVEHSYQSISQGYICDQAKNAIDAGNPGTAIELLHRLALTHNGLTGNERNILDRALFKESDQLIITGNYQRAREDLLHISAAFTPSEEVHEKLQVCDLYIAQQSTQAAKAPHLNDAHASKRMPKHNVASNIVERARRRLATASSAQTVAPTASTTTAEVASTASTTAANVSPSITTASAMVSSATNLETTVPPAGATPDSKASTVASTATVSDAAPTSAGKTPSQVGGKTKRSKTAAADFSHNDVARYNALLAGYFSSRGGGDGELREPLSFREWIDKGKPKF